MERYFTVVPVPGARLGEAAELGLGVAAAHNGWIWGAAGVDDFAAPGSDAYLVRSVIIWSDSVKLRYGAGPGDNPWLWAHITQYVQWTARHFHGLFLFSLLSPLPLSV